MACKDIVSMAMLLQSQDWEGHAVPKCALFAVVLMSVNTKNKRNGRLAFCFPCKDVLDWPYEIGTSKKSQKTLHSCSVSKSQCVSLSRPLPWWVLHGWGYVHIRIRLLPIVVSGDCLASVPTLCLPHWLLARVWCPMIQGCISTSHPSLLIHVCAPEGRVSWSHVCPLAW